MMDVSAMFLAVTKHRTAKIMLLGALLSAIAFSRIE
jgi:hypothetical protein